MDIIIVPQKTVQLTHVDFLGRFTATEYDDIEQAALVNIDVKFTMKLWDKAQYIDLNDPRTINGVHALESAGLIGAGRAAQILA